MLLIGFFDRSLAQAWANQESWSQFNTAIMPDNTAVDPFFVNLQRMFTDFEAMFPRCEETGKKKRAFDVAASSSSIKEAAVKMWAENLQDFYSECSDRDEAVIPKLMERISVLREIDFVTKWGTFTKDDRHLFWDYMQTLNRYACMYNLLSDGQTAFIFKYEPEIRPHIETRNLEGIREVVSRALSALSPETHRQLRLSMTNIYLAQGGMKSIEDHL